MSPKEKADATERYVATPTDFSTDYHKTGPSSMFDGSNVLAWLQSPTANGLFSPGFGSMLNTPNRDAAKPTPNRTPVVSTSFFFSDVASLPKQNEPQTPREKGGMSNIICISPLASKKQQQQTPVDLKEVFASPRERKYKQASSGKSDPSLDAVVLAERDLMEDEDLSVLLQLASNTTPRGGPLVFRSPRKPSGAKDDNNNSDLPALQLPMIGGKDVGPKSRLAARKSKSRSNEDFAPPQLGMRSSSSATTATKEIYVGGNKKHDDKDGKQKNGGISNCTKFPQHQLPFEPPFGFAIPPGIPPGMPTGSMRVSIGGPPPKKGSPGRGGNSPPAPPFDYPGMPPYPPHPGMYPPYGGPIMGYPPYTSHYPPPPPRHLPMYGAAQSPDNKTETVKNKKVGGTKRSSPTSQEAKNKRKKTPSGQSKKKNKSPQLTDRVERQKAAAAIQDLNAASGGKNDKAAALAAAILRGVTMRPSGKWQAQLYFAGKSRYIGVFDTREKAALAYEIAREKLKSGHTPGADGKTTENLVNAARKAAFDGVSERLK
jgi:hypothetical protein